MKKLIAAVIVLAVILVCVFVVFNSNNERLEPSYIQTKSCLANGLSDTTFVSMGEFINHGEIPVPNETILGFLHLDAWAETAAPREEQTCKLIVHLGDEYDVYIYDSYAYVYDGYADPGKNTGAYYTIPQEAIAGIDSFIQSRGTR